MINERASPVCVGRRAVRLVMRRLMVTALILFGLPRDERAFDAHFDRIHRPILGQLPNVERVAVNRVVDAAIGTAPYYLIVELQFPTEEAMQEGLNSNAGQSMARDFQAFASGGVTVLFCRPTTEP